ncbi:MAG: hypothetical protein K2O18_13595 [Oscillospiraceae bacterium]|nr:hypothetical protein [Oscillospiraceae bacterium]
MRRSNLDIQNLIATTEAQWVNFYAADGKFLGGYTLRGTFAGEMQATKELLAAENGCRPEDIRATVENEKGRDKA